jgi:alkylation response protein AidB-like acyl-CoA dehydrogenase
LDDGRGTYPIFRARIPQMPETNALGSRKVRDLNGAILQFNPLRLVLYTAAALAMCRACLAAGVEHTRVRRVDFVGTGAPFPPPEPATR